MSLKVIKLNPNDRNFHRKIDCLVAEHIFDQPWKWCPIINGPTAPANTVNRLPLPYSTDITVAWQIAEDLRREDYDVNISMYQHEYQCRVDRCLDYGWSLVALVPANTASLAICLATLKAKAGIEIILEAA